MTKDKKQNKKFGINITIYFTILISLVIILTIASASAVAYVLDYFFNITLHISENGWVIIFSVILGVAVAIFVSKILLSPIKKLATAMKKVALRDFTVRLETRSSITEVRELYDNFNLMTSELGATEILQTDFVSNVSHEFKTPINAIEGYAMLLQEQGLPPEEQAEYVSKILFNTKRLSELVGNILLLSKLENQAIPQKRTLYRLDEQIRKAILLLETKWTKKNIVFEIDLDEVSCTCNESLMLHVWTNLLDNAIKFNSEGGTIKMELTEKDGSIIFTIADNGCGIAEEDCKHIFDKFYQSDSSRKDEGSGLGLALVKQLIDLYGGSISVKSVPGKGTCFTVILPNS